ncbi:MAG: hypothetical protein M3471_04095, partial [Actinomycetota bacterium]|nr:hypothetical protein [Actinomycetota bacterium]
IHGSGPNTSDRPRRALVARYHPPITRVTTGAWPSTRVLRPWSNGLRPGGALRRSPPVHHGAP